MAEDKFPELLHRKKRKKANPVENLRSSSRVCVKNDDGEAVDGGETTEERELNEGLVQDPLEVLGPEIMMKILSLLDARSVAVSLVVSRRWNGVACSDRLWAKKCEELWQGKAHIPRASQMRGLSKLAAYSISIMDGKRVSLSLTRTHGERHIQCVMIALLLLILFFFQTRITREDLCDHAWKFHFGKVAPEYWRNLDPYWNGTGAQLRRYFHPDGSITADPGDEVWGGHECCFSIITTSWVGDGKTRNHYVRINRWPRLAVSRKEDWSWELSNSMCCYTSIPNAADKEGGTGPLISSFL